MRITRYIPVLGAAVLAAVAGCTVKDVDQPAFGGPSTFAHSITMVADRDSLTQNGVDFTDIRITSIGPDGQSETIPLRAQIFVDGVAQDFGTLSTKTPITPTTIRYTAPPGSATATAQSFSTVQIAVTPSNAGDFAGEFTRHISLQLQPQGVILPNNPNLVPDFTVTPTSPQVGQSATFDATLTKNGGSGCGLACTYQWDFGDGVTSTGLTTSHAFKNQGSFPVKLTVTDSRGAQQVATKVITVAAPAAVTGTITQSPANPVPTNADVFFNASAVQWPGRAITGYEWNFGDGSTGSGVTTSHRFSNVGTYSVILTVTDSAGTRGLATPVTVTVNQGTITAVVTANKVGGLTVTFDASGSQPSNGASMTNYRFAYGDGVSEDSSVAIQSHTYGAPGTYTVTLQVTDSNGKTAITTISVTVP